MRPKGVHSKKEKILRDKILRILKEQGFSVNPHLRPPRQTKQLYKKLQRRSRLEQLSIHKNFLENIAGTAKMFCRDGHDIRPEEITLEIRDVKRKSLEEDLFRW